MLPLPLPHRLPAGTRGQSGTNLWRTWHQLQLKVRSEDMQASQLRCSRQAAERRRRPLSTGPPQAPQSTTFLSAESSLNCAVFD